MCAEPVNDLLHFLGIEKVNELHQIINLGEDYFLIHNLDALYRDCLDLKPIDDPKLKLPSFLYLIVHSEYYNSMSSFLRMHQSKSFVSLRISIDCSFTAYYLLKYPEKTDAYLSKVRGVDDPELNKVFYNIKTIIKNSIDDFPHAKTLPEIHEVCSRFTHSDALGIMHRYHIDNEKMRLEAKYFDYEPTDEDYKKKLSCLLIGYYNIFQIFWNELFKARAEDKLAELTDRIEVFHKRLIYFHDKYPLIDG